MYYSWLRSPKPWGGGKVVKSWQVDKELIEEAIK